MGALNIYIATDTKGRVPAHLIVARDEAQACAVAPVGTIVTRATVFQAYRFGKLQVPLEYARTHYAETIP